MGQPHSSCRSSRRIADLAVALTRSAEGWNQVLRKQSQLMLSRLKAAWDWLPVIVRAIVMGFVLLTIGSTVTFLPLLGNLKFHPEIPWAFPMTLVILAGYAAYFSGWGPPAATRAVRQKLARASWPSTRIWRATV